VYCLRHASSRFSWWVSRLTVGSFTCENCTRKMRIANREYQVRSAGGRLVYCDDCVGTAEPRRILDTGRVVPDIPERVLKWRRQHKRMTA
jgi:hypothetical protein